MAEHQASTLECIIHGGHIYMQIWRLVVWEILTLEREEGNNHDKFTVSLLMHGEIAIIYVIGSRKWPCSCNAK